MPSGRATAGGRRPTPRARSATREAAARPGSAGAGASWRRSSGAPGRARPRLRALVRAGVARPRPRGPPGRGHGARGRVDRTRSSTSLSQQHVIGSSLAFRISDLFHGTPTVLPGSYALHQNQTFAEVRAILAAGPNIYPVDVRPGFTLPEVARAGRRPPRPRAGRLREGGGQRRGALGLLAAGLEQPRGHARAPGTTWSSRARATPRSCATWCSASTATPARPG